MRKVVMIQLHLRSNFVLLFAGCCSSSGQSVGLPSTIKTFPFIECGVDVAFHVAIKLFASDRLCSFSTFRQLKPDKSWNRQLHVLPRYHYHFAAYENKFLKTAVVGNSNPKYSAFLSQSHHGSVLYHKQCALRLSGNHASLCQNSHRTQNTHFTVRKVRCFNTVLTNWVHAFAAKFFVHNLVVWRRNRSLLAAECSIIQHCIFRTQASAKIIQISVSSVKTRKT